MSYRLRRRNVFHKTWKKQPGLKKDFSAVCGGIFSIRAANESSEHYRYLSNGVCSIVARLVLHTSNCSFLKHVFFLSVAVETRDDHLEMRCIQCVPENLAEI